MAPPLTLAGISQGQLGVPEALALQNHTVSVSPTGWSRSNSYSFALGEASVGPTMPGWFALRTGSLAAAEIVTGGLHLSERGFRVALALDGLELVREGFVCPDTHGWLVIGMLADNHDYHFVRMLGPGLLVHKPGDHPPRRMSVEGEKLSTPTGLGRTPYRTLGAWWYSPDLLGTPLPGAEDAAHELLTLTS